jgi:N-acetylglutamate synthase
VIEAIERATLDAVAPNYVAQLPGWLVPFARGSVGRAKSAVPITHAAPDPQAIKRILALYKAGAVDQNLGLAAPQPAQFRLPSIARFDEFKVDLSSLGFVASKSTHVQTADPKALFKATHARDTQTRLLLSTRPDQSWAAVYRRQGFDAQDAEHRIRLLSLAKDAVYGTVVNHDGFALTAGVMSISHGWASVHGIRTDPLYQGRGLATQLMAGFGQRAVERSLNSIFLQVEAENQNALRLYQRIGFKTQWQYTYWAQHSV